MPTLDKPSDVSAENGNVIVDGPDGVAYSMTPDAATRTSARLLHSAAQAEGQRREALEQRKRDGAGKRSARHH